MVLCLLSTFEISFHEHFKAVDNAIRIRVAVMICLACGGNPWDEMWIHLVMHCCEDGS